jgi:hypothetical protein
LLRQFRSVTVSSKYLNTAIFFKDLLDMFTLWFYPSFCWQAMNIYLVPCVFISRPY